jgi:hypothetical protein
MLPFSTHFIRKVSVSLASTSFVLTVILNTTPICTDVEAKETDTLRIKWVEKGNIESYDDFETWSALIHFKYNTNMYLAHFVIIIINKTDIFHIL